MPDHTLRLRVNRSIGSTEIKQLAAAGCSIEHADGDRTYVVRSTARSPLPAAMALDFVESAEVCGDHEKLDRTLAAIVRSLDGSATTASAMRAPLASDRIQVIVGLRPDDPKTVDAIGAMATVVDSTSRRALVEVDPGQIEALAKLAGVSSIEVRSDDRTSNNVARTLVGVAPTAENLGLDGTGEIVGVADSGLDTGNVGAILDDFGGRVLNIRNTGPKDPAFPAGTLAGSDLNNHGTHVAGSIAGDGAKSNGKIQGMAPAAELTFLAMGPNESTALRTPFDLAVGMLQPAYDDGARIHSNSWGSTTQLGIYSARSDDIDHFVWDNPDMLVVFAAGNDGGGASTVSAPGTAKNCLTVGASESVRPLPPVIELDPNFVDHDNDPVTAMVNVALAIPTDTADDPDDIAGFSGRGPVNDGAAAHQKPDIVAPGTMILSTRSTVSVADTGPDGLPPGAFDWEDGDLTFSHDEAVGKGLPGAPFFGTWNQDTPDAPPDSGADAQQNYFYSDGTSMATPIASGTAALLRQYLRTRRGATAPTAALMKAMIINGAAVPAGQSTDQNNDRGFGWLNLAGIIAPEPTGQQIYADDVDLAVATGETRMFSVVVADTSHPLRATLAWTDPAGKGLQNKLYLRVVAPDGSRVDGDVTAYPNPTNNVQRVHIAAPSAGTYTVEVHGVDVPFSIPALAPALRQDFAVAVSNGVGFTPAPVDVVQVLDHSGSMGFYGFMEPAKLRAAQLIDVLRVGDRAGIVQFDDTADVVAPLTLIAGHSDQLGVQGLIDGIMPAGNTSIGAGLGLAVAELDVGSTRPQSIVLLSDGHENTPPWVGGGIDDSPPAWYGGGDVSEALPSVPMNTKVYTVSLGTASDEVLLQDLALARGGQFHSVYSAADQAKLHEIYVHLQALTGGEEVLASGSGFAGSSGGTSARGSNNVGRSTLAATPSRLNSEANYASVAAALPGSERFGKTPLWVPDWLRELLRDGRWDREAFRQCSGHEVSIDESIRSVTFVVSWHDPGQSVQPVLRGPSLRRVDLNGPGVWTAAGSSHIVIRIEDPEPGLWCLDAKPLEGDGLHGYTYGVHGTTTVGLRFAVNGRPTGSKKQQLTADFIDPDDLAVRPTFTGRVSLPKASLAELAKDWSQELEEFKLPDEPRVPDVDPNRQKLGLLDLVLRSQGGRSIFRTSVEPMKFGGKGIKAATFQTPLPGITTAFVSVAATSRAGFKVVRERRLDLRS